MDLVRWVNARMKERRREAERLEAEAEQRGLDMAVDDENVDMPLDDGEIPRMAREDFRAIKEEMIEDDDGDMV